MQTISTLKLVAGVVVLVIFRSFVRSFVRSFAFLCPDSLGQEIKCMITLYTSSDNDRTVGEVQYRLCRRLFTTVSIAAAITMQIQII